MIEILIGTLSDTKVGRQLTGLLTQDNLKNR